MKKKNEKGKNVSKQDLKKRRLNKPRKMKRSNRRMHRELL
jgi:hypothetical protein